MKQHGFSLIELMVTIAIVAVLLGIATPSFLTSIQNNRITSKTNELVIALSNARQVAISSSTTTFVYEDVFLIKPRQSAPPEKGVHQAI